MSDEKQATRNFRIAFTGASGTGKTTLVSILAEKLGLEVNPVGSRSVALAMGFRTPYDVDKVGRRAEFQERLVQEKWYWEQQRADFITDRSMMDNYVYALMHEGIPRQYSDHSTMHVLRQYMAHYTHVFFCPIHAFHDVADDPSRVNDSSYHARYEETLLSTYKACGVDVIHVPSGTVDERVRFAIEQLAGVDP